MQEELEQNAAAPSDHHKPRRKRRIALSMAVIIVIGVAITVGGLMYSNRNNSPLPKKVIKDAVFSLYYPSPVPAGFKLDAKSVQNENQIIFFNFTDGSHTINVSEQAAPNPAPDFLTIQKFNKSLKSINSTAGQAIEGIDSQSKNLVAIISTNTTLITMSAPKNVPQDVMTKIVQSMSSIPQ